MTPGKVEGWTEEYEGRNFWKFLQCTFALLAETPFHPQPLS